MLRNIKKFNSDFGDHSHNNYISMSDLALDSKFEFIEKYGSAGYMRDQDCYICGGNDFKHLKDSSNRTGYIIYQSNSKLNLKWIKVFLL